MASLGAFLWLWLVVFCWLWLSFAATGCLWLSLRLCSGIIPGCLWCLLLLGVTLTLNQAAIVDGASRGPSCHSGLPRPMLPTGPSCCYTTLNYNTFILHQQIMYPLDARILFPGWCRFPGMELVKALSSVLSPFIVLRKVKWAGR